MKRGFPGGMGGGGGANMNMMKQVQKMQQDMMEKQELLETKEYTAGSGGGAVAATVNGKHQLVNITLSPEAVNPEDTEMLQDMIIAAVNEAMRQAEEASASEIKKVTGGLNIPGMF